MQAGAIGQRQQLVRRAAFLEAGIAAYNIAEGLASVVAGLLAGSVVLVGFGLDSALEVSAGLVVLWHLLRSGDEERPEWEQRIATFVGITLLAIALYVLVQAIFDLASESRPSASYAGIAITLASVIVMPIVSRLQRDLATKINSRALAADSRETLVCTYLSAATLMGLAANALFGWWWADPAAGLLLSLLISREGLEIVRSRELVCVDD